MPCLRPATRARAPYPRSFCSSTTITEKKQYRPSRCSIRWKIASHSARASAALISVVINQAVDTDAMISEALSPIQFLGLLLAVSLLVDLIGFYRTVWFISIGYAASIVAFVVVVVGFHGTDLVPLLALQLLGALIWGTRLGLFLAARERKPSYQASVKEQTDKSTSLPIFVKIGIWSSTSLLYVCMFSPAVFLAQSIDSLNDKQTKIAAAGVGVMWLGLALEALADHQKSSAKSKAPSAFVSLGLYSWVRYPNYFGEISFWTGNFLAGIVAYNTWWSWVTALTGVVCIILIMMGSTKRLETKQEERYGDDPNYKKYMKTVPVLFPWLPIYSLKNIKVYLE